MKKSVFFIPTNSSRVIPFFLFCLFCAGRLSAATWYVKTTGSDANAGNSWASAYQTLTKALQSAASGDQIWVATGTYKPTTGTDRTISFNMKNGVAILGGFPATGNPVLADRDWETHVTTLSGDIGTAGDNSDNSYHVVYSASLNNTAILDGFVVTGGNANDAQPHDHGGGLKNASSSPTIQYCSFFGNSAISGGGVSNFGNSSAIYNHCNFSNNSATSGGGMYNYTSAPTVKNSTFSGNSAGASGGAAFNHTNAAPKFINCIFYSNSGGTNGSAIGTTFSSVTLANCSISGNSGGGITITSLSSTATITNCNIWGNSSSITDINGTTTVSYSNVQGGYSGTGNLNVDPLFVNAPGDLRLQACSPVINKGSNAAVPAGITTDLDDNNRFFGTVDMGAYEYQNNPPVLAAVCKNITIQLATTGNVSIPASAVDNGSTGCNLSMYLSQTNFNCSNVGANNLLFVVSDNNFHSASCAVTVTVQDNTIPTASCKNATVQLDATGNVTVPASAVDNGSTATCGNVTLTLSKSNFNCSNVGNSLVSLEVQDYKGNKAYCSTTITVQDNVAPTAVCKNATVQLDATGAATITTATVNNGSTDACGIASLVLSKTTFNCSNTGANTVTLTVTDNNGKTATCNATVTVQDNTAPTAVCQNATVQLDATGNVTVPASALNNGSADACGIASLALSKTTFNCSNVGANAVTLTVTDNNGKTATCSATVTVQDNTLPTAICKNATVQLDASGNVTVPASAVDNGSTDACGIAALTLSKTNFNCSNVGSILVSLEVRDNNGNKAYCSTTVTVQDNIPPTAICKNATVQLDATGNVTVPASAVNNGSTDACGIAALALSKTTFNCSNTGANAVTLTVTDNNGKTATCTATVTVQDNTAPTAICQNATVQLDATGNVTVPASAVNNGSSDACGIAALALSKTTFNCSNTGANAVTLTVTDNNGKTATCSATLTVQDNTAPTAVCQNATVQLDATGNVTVPASAVNNGSTDACGIASLALSKTTFDCSNTGANAVTLTVTDNNGKTATCTATVTVQDNTAPTAVCQNATVQLDATGNVTVPASAVNNGSADACGIASLALSKTTFNCSNTGANAVTLTVTDNNGKTATCTATVTVQDNTAPTAVCQNATVQLDATGNVTVPASAVNNGSADACGIAALALSKTTFNCSNTGANAVTLTVTDNNGKTATCSATVTVQDNTAPTAVCQNATVQLDATGNVTVPASAVNNGSADACGIASLALSKTTFDCSNTGANTVTLTVTDNNGKTATCNATVTVQDNTAPTVNCPGDITVVANQNNPCSAFVGQNLNATWSDNCSAGLTYLFSGAMTGSGLAQVPPTTFPSGVTAITYTAMDQSQHSAQCTFHVTVNGCGTAVSGKLIWENNNQSGVGNAVVSLSGGQTGSMTTTSDGLFSFSVDPGSNVTITPAKNTNKLNGLTSADVTAIQQHVANINLLPAPFKRIAADVNKSNSISTLDATLINQALLGNQAALNQIYSWRFVPASYTFPNPNAPWGFPEQINLTGVSGLVADQNFYGIKLGDVVSTWANPANAGASGASDLVFRIQDHLLEAGSEVTADFRADQLDDLNSFQFALHFDPEQLQLVEIEPLGGLPVTLDNFGTYQVAEGEIRVVWAQATSVLLSEAAPVFRLRFTALESGARLSEVLQLNNESLPAQVFNSKYAASSVELRYSATTGTGSGVEPSALTLDNQPNPFTAVTTLHFDLPQAGDAELRITDAAGHLVFSQKKQYTAGRHEETLRLDGVSGMLLAELVTQQGSVVRRLLALR